MHQSKALVYRARKEAVEFVLERLFSNQAHLTLEQNLRVNDVRSLPISAAGSKIGMTSAT